MNCIKVKRNNLLNSIYSFVSADFRFKGTPYVNFFILTRNCRVHCTIIFAFRNLLHFHWLASVLETKTSWARNFFATKQGVSLPKKTIRHCWGWHPPPPLRTAYRPILALRTAYRHFSASRTAYRLTTKTTIFGVSIYIKKTKWKSVACTCTTILANVSVDVFACDIS